MAVVDKHVEDSFLFPDPNELDVSVIYLKFFYYFSNVLILIEMIAFFGLETLLLSITDLLDSALIQSLKHLSSWSEKIWSGSKSTDRCFFFVSCGTSLFLLSYRTFELILGILACFFS